MLPTDRCLRESCLKKQYGLEPADLLERYGLVPPEEAAGLESLRLARSGLLAACSVPALPADRGAAAVVGAPCIDHCGGDPRRLTVQAFADIVYVVATARDLGLPALVTLSTREEEIVMARAQRHRAVVWREIGALVAEWVRIVARALGAERVRVWQTYDPECESALSAVAEETSALLPDRDLEGLYSLDGSSSFPAGSPVFAAYSIYFRRNVVNYIPEFVRQGLGAPIERVIVAENIQQHKAVARARELAARRQPGGGPAVIHLASLPTPSLSGRSRMSRAGKDDQIFVADAPDLLAARLSTAAETTVWYWRALLEGLGEGVDEALAECRSTFQCW